MGDNKDIALRWAVLLGLAAFWVAVIVAIWRAVKS
jgi:hypothetical protein